MSDPAALDPLGATAVAPASASDGAAPDPVGEAPPDPAAEAAAREAAEAAEREAQLQRLLMRMQKSADFPALKDTIRGIQKISRSETAHLRALSEEVLGDVAMTNKLLRLINTAFYSSVGGGSITSINRAIALMGFQSIGILAASLAMFERLPKGPDGERVRAEFRRALLAAMLASELCPGMKQRELAYLAGLFQNLGTMLSWMHFRDEAEQIESRMKEQGLDPQDHAARQPIAREVLGIGDEELAVEVASHWGWPDDLQLALRRLDPRDPETPAGSEERLRIACTAANRLARKLEHLDTPEEIEACLAEFLPAYGVPLGLDEQVLAGAVERARQEWIDIAALLGLPGAGGAKAPAAARSASPAAPPTRGTTAAPASVKATPSRAAAPVPRPPQKPVPAAVGQALTRALESVSQTAMSDAPLSQVLQALMAQLHEALELQRVVVCLRDGSSGDLQGRLGLGERGPQLAGQFRIPTRPPSCLFGLLSVKGADTLISDTGDPVIAQRLPAWFQRQVQAPTFLLLPLQFGGQPLGLIYGDRARAHSLLVGDAELTLLKAMRNQLIMAMRLRGSAG